MNGVLVAILALLAVKIALAALTALLYALGAKGVVPAGELKPAQFYGALFLSSALYALAIAALISDKGFWWPLALAPNVLALASFTRHWPSEIGKINIVLTVVLIILLALPPAWQHAFGHGR